MLFDDLESAEKFYKEYAHDTGFLFVSGNKDVMTMALLSGNGFCVQGKEINHAQQPHPITLPSRCVRLESLDVDVKLIFM
jgi:hypothetical protein